MYIQKPELLAPAGNREKLETAILYGADAVYVSGLLFGMRAYAGNFSQEELKSAVLYCHEHGVKLYVTVNILAHNQDLVGIEEYLTYLHQINVDAVIIADLGIFKICREKVPGLSIHISTQFSATNYQTCNFLKDIGAERVVLPRELSFAEIEEIKEKSKVELEVFVHGAMCMAYSGRCMISYHTTNRDANRGACAQPCRHPFQLSSKILNEDILVEANEEGTYFFNSKDLCLIEHLPSLINLGVHSFKIEGRMKTAAYLAGVIKVYREAIDLYCQNPNQYNFNADWLNELQRISNRGYTTFKFLSKDAVGYQNHHQSRAEAEGEIVGVIKEIINKKLIAIEVKAAFRPNQELEIVIPGEQNLIVYYPEIKNLLGEVVEKTKPNQIVTVKYFKSAPPGSIIRSMKNSD